MLPGKARVSLNFVQQFELPFTAKIIDIGGVDSNFVHFLLQAGYRDISVLDISEKSLEKAKERLKRMQINYLDSD